MRPSTSFITVLGVAAVIFIAGCGGDDPAGPTPLPKPSESLPVPPEYDDTWQPPPRTEGVVLGVADISDFMPLLNLRAYPDADPPAHLEIEITEDRSVLMKDSEVVLPQVTIHARVLGSGTGWTNADPANVGGCFRPLVTYGGKNYYISGTMMALDVARWNCRIVGGHLLDISDQAENDAITASLPGEIVRRRRGREPPDLKLWISLWDSQDVMGYVWLDGEPSHHRNWYPGEPNSASEQATIFLPDGRWVDVRADEAYLAVLETEGTCSDSEEPELAQYSIWVQIPSLLQSQGGLFLRKIQQRPRLLRRQYWEFVYGKWIYPGEVWEYQTSYQTGVEETQTTEFARTKGSITVGYKDIMVELGDELTEKFGTHITLTDVETVTTTRTYSGREGVRIWWALWQAREEYVFVDENGDPWTDPQFQLRVDPSLDRGLPMEDLTIVEY